MFLRQDRGAAHGPLWDAIRAKGRRVEVIAIGAELDAVPCVHDHA